MTTIRKAVGFLVALFMVLAILPWNIQAEGFAIPAPDEFNVTSDTETFNLSWNVSDNADYYLVQIRQSGVAQDWQAIANDPGVLAVAGQSGHRAMYLGNSYTPTITAGSYDFRVFACDASGNQVGEAAEIDDKQLLQQDPDVVQGMDDGKTYAHIHTAFEAGQYRVKLVKDVIEQVDIWENQTVTIDLNGHKLTATNGYALENFGTCTIQDSSANADGVITSDQGTTPVWNGLLYNGTDASVDAYGTMIINGGIIRQAHDASGAVGNSTTLRNNGIVTINGGKIDGGMILTGWNPANGIDWAYSVIPDMDETVVIGKGADLANATITLWQRGIVKYLDEAKPAPLEDDSKYNRVSPESLNSTNENIKTAANVLLKNTTTVVSTDDLRKMEGNGESVYPVITVVDAESADSGKLSRLVLDIELYIDKVNDDGTVTTEPYHTESALTIKIALPDSFETDGTDAVQIRHTKEDGKVYTYQGRIVTEVMDDLTVKYAVFDNPDGFSTFEITKAAAAPAVSPAPAAKTTAKNFLVTYLDCKGNTVSVQWIPSGGSPVAPAGYSYPAVSNVTSHQDVRPSSCKVQAQFIVPNTADRG